MLPHQIQPNAHGAHVRVGGIVLAIANMFFMHCGGDKHFDQLPLKLTAGIAKDRLKFAIGKENLPLIIHHNHSNGRGLDQLVDRSFIIL